ncbi:hypothetical protein DCC62_32785, partial [candidate division KSB1 bacterium]
RIVKTVISSQPDGGIGSVNTNQTFTINVDVNNIGFERLDSVLVTLRALNNSLPAQQQRAIRAIDNGGTGTAVFTVTAPSTPTIGDDLEQFQAQIDAAFTPTTRAQVDAAFDSTAAVRVQTPALLQLQTALPNVANNQLTIGQTFTLRATVTNLGQAEFDNSGRVQLIPPYPLSLLRIPSTLKCRFCRAIKTTAHLPRPPIASPGLSLTSTSRRSPSLHWASARPPALPIAWFQPSRNSP